MTYSPRSRRRAEASSEAPWDHIDRLRERHVPRDALPSDVYRVSTTLDADTADGSDSEEYYDLRHITHMSALLVGGAPFQVFVDSAAVSLMALHHFNSGIDDVVPEIGKVRERCRTRFTMDFIDTKFSPIETSGAFLRDVLTRSERWEDGVGSGGGGGTANDARSSGAGRKRRLEESAVGGQPSQSHLRPDPQPIPTVMLGAVRSAVSSPLATLASVYRVPQISYASTATSLDNRDQFPYFGRVVPSAAGDADAAVDYLTGFLKLTHLGVLYIRDSYGTTYAQAILNAAGEAQDGKHPLKVRTASFPAGFRSQEERLANIAEAIRQLKESGLRYFFGIFSYDWYNLIMSEAHRQGIVGEGHYWMFGDGLMGVSDFSYDPETQADLIEATRGSALITTASPMILKGLANYDAFVRHWDEMRIGRGPGREYFEAKMPIDFRELDGGKALRENEFSAVPFATALMGYDSTISAIFAACDAEEVWRLRENGGNGAAGLAHIDGDDFFRAFLNHTYDGVYGSVTIDSATGTRIPQTVPYSVSNFLTAPPGNDGMVKVTLTTTDVLEKSPDGGSQWRNLEAFVFSDGSTQPPSDLPPLEHDLNLIGTGTRVAASIMCSIILFTSMFFLWWTYKHRQRRVIRSAQPVFLWILAGGALLMGLAIVPLGIEEPQASSQLALDVACMSSVWLVTVGFSLTFSALYAKTLRINMIMKRKDLRRVKVEAGQVMRPAAMLVCLNAAIMTIWNIAAPLRYYREPTGSVDEYGRVTSSVGMCSLPRDPNDPDKNWWVGILFIVIIAVVNGSMLAAALYQEQRAKRIETEYSESKFVKLSVLSIVQAWLVGIPLLFIGRDSPSGMYMVTSTILFIMCESILALIFIPKMWFLREWKKKQEFRESERKRKAQTPTWILNDQKDEQSSWRFNYRGSDRVKESVRNLMQKVTSSRGFGLRSSSGAAMTGESGETAIVTDTPSSPPERSVRFADNAELPPLSEGLEQTSFEDDPASKRLNVSTVSIGDSVHLEEGVLKVSIREARVMKSLEPSRPVMT